MHPETVSAADQGPQSSDAAKAYQLTFVGNVSLSEEQLRSAAAEELHDFITEGYTRATIDDAAFQMELLYRRNGFPLATVTYEYDDTFEMHTVLFQIDEGPASVVRNLEITGTQGITKESLLELFRGGERQNSLKIPGQPYIKSQWFDFVKDIKEFYLERGFLDLQIQGPIITMSKDKTSVDIGIHITEGQSYLLGTLQCTGEDLTAVMEQLQNMAKQYQGKVYSPRLKIHLTNNITGIMANAGFAEATVQVTTRKAGGVVHADAVIKSGPRVTVDKIVITGNERTKERFIRSLLSVETGTWYNLEAKQKSFNRLYRTGLFSSVNIDLIGEEDAAQRPMEVRVAELPAREIYLEPGWGSYELARFIAGYRDKNIFGSGKSLRLDGGASFKGRNLLLGFTNPWLLGYDISLDLPLYYSYRIEPSYTEEQIGATVQLHKKISRSSNLNLGYFYDSSRLYDIAQGTELALEDDDYVTAGGRVQISRDTRNDIFFPSQGYKGNVLFELSDPVLGSEISYTRFLAGINAFLSLPGDFILGMRWKTGFMLPFSKDNTIPLGERFFNGGENTVRSFRESDLGPLDSNGDPVGGTAYNVFSLELRKKLDNHFAGTLFIDVGNIVPDSEKKTEDSFWKADRASQWRETFGNYFNNMRTGIGFGLQYMLPVGPLRLDIAFNPDQRPRENAYAIHFSIGMAF